MLEQNVMVTNQCISELHLICYLISLLRTVPKWMPAYILDMLELPEEIRSVVEDGQFAIGQASGKVNGIWSDMVTEKKHY